MSAGPVKGPWEKCARRERFRLDEQGGQRDEEIYEGAVWKDIGTVSEDDWPRGERRRCPMAKALAQRLGGWLAPGDHPLVELGR